MEMAEQIRSLCVQLEAMRQAGAKRLQYSKQFKRQVVALHGAGMSLSALATQLRISDSMIRNWVKAATPSNDKPQVLTVRDVGGAPSSSFFAESVQLRVGSMTVTIEMGRG
jgi:transposase-like protein